MLQTTFPPPPPLYVYQCFRRYFPSPSTIRVSMLQTQTIFPTPLYVIVFMFLHLSIYVADNISRPPRRLPSSSSDACLHCTRPCTTTDIHIDYSFSRMLPTDDSTTTSTLRYVVFLLLFPPPPPLHPLPWLYMSLSHNTSNVQLTPASLSSRFNLQCHCLGYREYRCSLNVSHVLLFTEWRWNHFLGKGFCGGEGFSRCIVSQA